MELVLETDKVKFMFELYGKADIIRYFRDLFNKRGRVLEIGAQLGDVTGWLSQNFKAVDCIESGINNAAALYGRVKKAKNVEVYAADEFETSFGEGKYSLVTAIGNLGNFANGFGKTAHKRTVDFLRNVCVSLTEDGILFISTQNKMALKYLSGCYDSKERLQFNALMDYPVKTAAVFGRNELEEILKEAGFNSIQFYHTYSDGMFPISIYRECEEIYKLNPDIFYPKHVYDYYLRQNFFLEPLAVLSLYKEKMVHYFSNSFVVLCSKSRNVNLKTNWIFAKWSLGEIKSSFQNEVKILPASDGGFFVEKSFINTSQTEYEDEKIRVSLKSGSYIHGKPLVFEAFKAFLADDNYEKLTAVLNEIKSELIKLSSGKDAEGYEWVDGKYYDFTFWNLIRHGGKLVYIDSKWGFKCKIPVDLIIWRNLFYFNHRCGDYKALSNAEIFSVLKAMFPGITPERVKFVVKYCDDLLSFIIPKH
ncbi:MAG: class I SAM-dependent methyltransferase [Clostridiales bacterium]|jgi:2-polyprenyl-3-methyl-5-hydroxy-6-metoxy-1,4-benzoquinol methylase|nr:class I SAM-dependent methyltransferase [Clostridiales bacterium]